MKVFGIFLISVLTFGMNNAKPANSNSQSYVQQMGGDNSNEQSKIQQMSHGQASKYWKTGSVDDHVLERRGNTNSQSGIQQHSGRAQPVLGRRGNSNSQIGVQQSGNGNSNRQESVQQHTRRANTNSQTNVQQKGRGNSNSQNDIQQHGRRAMIVRDCPPFLDPSNCFRRMIGARMGNSNVQKQVQQYGNGNSNEQSSVQQYGRRFSAPELNDQYQFGGAYEPIQPPVVWGGPDAFNPNSEYGIEGVGIPSYSELTLPQQNGILGGVYGSYQQGLVGSPSFGGTPWGYPEYSGYGNSLGYASLGGQYQPGGGLGYLQAQSPYGQQAQVYG